MKNNYIFNNSIYHKIKLILFVVLIVLLYGFLPSYGQISIPPAEGDRASYYLVNSQWGSGGLVWETEFNYTSPIILKSFRDTENESYWIQNLNMKTKEFKEFLEYMQNNNIGTNGYGSTSNDDGEYELDSFEIYFEDFNKTKDLIKRFFNGGSMTVKVAEIFREIESVLDRASRQLTEQEYMELCENVESSADARYMAMEQQIKNDEEMEGK